jgi:hypothetical protein
MYNTLAPFASLFEYVIFAGRSRMQNSVLLNETGIKGKLIAKKTAALFAWARYNSKARA